MLNTIDCRVVRGSIVSFHYHGVLRIGSVEVISNPPRGNCRYLTLRHIGNTVDRPFSTYDLHKIEDDILVLEEA